MYAIIEFGNHQYKVEPNCVIEVNHQELEQGQAFETTKVLMVSDGKGKIKVGAPYVDGSLVKGTIIEHLRGDKVVVFKQKRRKNYKRTRGHRQELTRIQISAIESK